MSIEVSSHRNTLDGLLEQRASAAPDAPALLASGGSTMSYGELAARLAGIGALLDTVAAKRDRAVAVVLPNGVEMALAFLGIASRAVCAPLNPTNTQAELDFYFDDLDPMALVTDGCSAEAEAVAAARGLPILRPSDAVAINASRPSTESAHADDIALVLHTSGTTSRPKQVPLTQANLCASAASVAATLELTEADRGLNVMPLFHIHGLVAALLASLRAGGSVVCTPGFDPSSFLGWANDTGATWYTAVPTMHQAVLSAVRAAGPGPTLGFRFIRSSSAALPPVVLHDLEAAFGVPVIEAYGMTEAAHQMASNPLPPRPRKPGTVGLAAGPDVAVMAADTTLVAAGKVGEIVIRGPNVTTGYLANPEANATAFADGWFRTGDQGCLDDDGYLTITGRLKEIINRGGEKISPREVDEALLEHPGVAQAVCFAVPHPTLGEDVAAAVVLSDGGVDPDALRRFVAERLSAHKVPHRILVLDELPKGPTGKLQRIGLADRLGLGAATLETEAAGPHHYATALESALARMWAYVLGVDNVGATDDFLDLGGDSLTAILLLGDVQDVFGVELPATAPFEAAPTVRAMAELVESLRRDGRSTTMPAELEDKPGAALTPGQEGLWFLDALTGHREPINSVISLRLAGELDHDALVGALDDLITRHDALRATYPAGADGRPRVIVHAPVPIELPVEDVADLDEAVRHAGALARSRLDPVAGPVFVVRLYRVSAVEHVFALVAHHVVMDDWSRGVIRNDLAASYEARRAGRSAPPAEIALGAPALAARRERRAEQGGLDEHLDYWQARFDPLPPALELPASRRRGVTADLRGAVLRTTLDGDLRARVLEYAKQERSTLFMVLLAAFVATLQQSTGVTDIVVGVPTAARTEPESGGVVGFITNTLPMRVDASSTPTFAALLAQVRSVCLAAYAHQDAPFERIVERLPIERHANRRTLAQVAFQLRNLPPVTDRMGDLDVIDLDVHPGTALDDLGVEVTDAGDHLALDFEYAVALFDEPDIAVLARRFDELLRAALRDPGAPVVQLAVENRERALAVVADDRPAIPEGNVHDWIARQASATPDAVALVASDATLTYRQLDERSNQLAHRLIAAGVASNQTVGLLLERDARMLVCILAALKAGVAFVPLDPGTPPTRTAAILDGADTGLIVTCAALQAGLPASSRPVLVLDREDVAGYPTTPPDRTIGPADLAYIMFTSGSTGVPKGVMIEHGAIASHLAAFVERVGLHGSDVVLASTPLTFDPSLLETLLPLTLGARVVLAPRALAADASGAALLASENGVTVLQGTPTTLGLLVNTGTWPATARSVWSGAERIPQPLAELLLERTSALWNLYGPTETTIYATAHRVERAGADIPIGQALPGYMVEITDATLVPVGAGVVGELVIGGPGVARGYIGTDGDDPQFVTTPGGRWYRTGDLARRSPRGELQFLGRRDNQVKLRGLRIELGDVEAALVGNPAVREAAADVRDDRMVAWVVSDRSPVPTPDELRRHAATLLPPGLVPSAFSIVDRLPLTASGKIDRTALVDAPPVGDGALDGRPPATDTEQVLAAIWDALLRVDRPIVRDDDFFALGGHSLLAIELAHEVELQFGVELPLAQLFETPTLAMLASAVDDLGPAERGGAGRRSAPAAVLLRPGSDAATPFFIVPGVWGTVLGLRKSAVLVDPPHPVYGFEAPGHRGGPPFVTVEDQAAEYAAEIDRVSPAGRVVLGGFSLGGLIAFEMACRLSEEGRDVHLVLVDPHAPMRPGEQPAPPRRRRLSGRLRRIARVVRSPRRLFRREAPTVHPALAKRPNLRVVIEGNGRARSQYRCRSRFAGDVTLIASAVRPIDEYVTGWRTFVEGSIDPHVVPGGHVELLDQTESMEAVIEVFNEVLRTIGTTPA